VGVKPHGQIRPNPLINIEKVVEPKCEMKKSLAKFFAKIMMFYFTSNHV